MAEDTETRLKLAFALYSPRTMWLYKAHGRQRLSSNSGQLDRCLDTVELIAVP